MSSAAPDAAAVPADRSAGPPDPDRLLDRLDPEQREVATTFGGPVAVIAGAGTGKTRAITHRIAYAVATGVYAPRSVLAVTFTTRAAGEMRGRLQQLGVPGIQARTFHSAALRQAQYFWPRTYRSELPPVLPNRTGLVAEAAAGLRLSAEPGSVRDLVTEIGWAKVSNVTPDDYPRLAARHHRQLASFDPETVARVFAGYEQIKRDRQRIDFEDILLCAAAMIAEHPQVAAEIRRTYRHLVVDEYQDVSPLQQALLDLWRGDGDDLCVVGDPAQTIHSFAGAQAGFLTGFARRHPGSAVIRLTRDYRSTPQVVSVANRVLQHARPPATTTGPAADLGAVTLQADREPGPEPVVAESADDAGEAAAVADWLAARHRAGVPYREMAVLFRVNAQAPAIEQALAERRMPYLVRGGERFYERPEVRQALLTLRTQARVAAEQVAGEQSVLEQVTALFGSLGWTEEAPTGSGAVRERWESLAALYAVATDVVGRTEGCSVADVSAELQRRAEAQHVPAADGVTVSTLHSAKGLEWDAVAVVGLTEGSLPFVLATSEEEIEEERRLFYVGITRARRQLRISWVRSRGSTSSTPSRFLDGIRPEPADRSGPRHFGSRIRQQRPSVLAATCRSCGRHLTEPGERRIGRHNDCPAGYDEQVLQRLKQWRKQQAASEGVPAFCVFTDATLVAIAEATPRSSRELIKVAGVGMTKISRYGADVLELLDPQDD